MKKPAYNLSIGLKYKWNENLNVTVNVSDILKTSYSKDFLYNIDNVMSSSSFSGDNSQRITVNLSYDFGEMKGSKLKTGGNKEIKERL